MKKIILLTALFVLGLTSCTKEVDANENVGAPVTTKTVEVRLGGGYGEDWYWNTNGEILYVNQNNKTVKAILDEGESIQVGGSFIQFYSGSSPVYTWLYASVVVDDIWEGNHTNNTSNYTYSYTNDK
jgi:hypothetical protein